MNRFLIAFVLVAAQVGCGAAESAGSAGEGADTDVVRKVAALTSSAGRSPWRDPSRDWREYANAFRQGMGRSLAAAATALVVDSQVPVANASFAAVPAWTDVDIKMLFRSTRDSRFMSAISDPNFARRCSWLFPDNGCFARAELVASMTGDQGRVKPYKLFSFGNLVVQTSNAVSGSVSWWYHVVPVVKSASSGKIYVLDAAIEPSQPLDWQAWLLRQVPTLSDVQVTVADSNAYDPGSPVTGAPNQRDTALADMQALGSFLDLEWARQIDLGRTPGLVLGDSPLWGPERFYAVALAPQLTVPACQTCLGADALSARCVQDCP